MASNLVSQQSPFSVMVKKFREGTSTPRDYLEACIDAIERTEPKVKAFVYYDLTSARAQADASTQRYQEGKALSPIDGMPIGIKDIIDTVDMPTGMNSPIYEGYYPRADAACVRAVREGGGVIVGKTVTTEFAIGQSGPTVNPHNEAHTPGGSSSGSAAGVAAGMFAAGFGTQTQGSIIRPAGFCGVVGYKPSLNMLSTDGIHPLSRTHDHLGVIADTLDDAWWLARWVSERATQQDSPGLSGPTHGHVPEYRLARVAVLRTDGFDDLDSPSLEAFERVLTKLRDLNVTPVEPSDNRALADLTDRLSEVPSKSLEMVSYDMRWPYSAYVAEHSDKLGQRIPGLVAKAQEMTREHYRDLLTFREDLRRRVAALSDEFDAFVLPSSSGPAPEGFEYTGARTLLSYSSFLGLPAFSLPVMHVGGLPFGLQMVGFSGADYRLARHAQWALAQLRP